MFLQVLIQIVGQSGGLLWLTLVGLGAIMLTNDEIRLSKTPKERTWNIVAFTASVAFTAWMLYLLIIPFVK